MIEGSSNGSVEALRVAKQVRSPDKLQETCTRCGRSHAARPCSALGKTCYACKGIDHVSAMCRTKKTKAHVQPVDEEVFSVGPVAEGMHEMQTNSNSDSKVESKLKQFHVGSIEGIGASWQQSLPTNGRMVQYKLDTGAQVNILPYNIYQQLSPRTTQHEVSAKLFAYGTVDPISVKGQCICNIGLQHGGSRQLRFYVLEAGIQAVPLLGLQACDQLSLVSRVEQQQRTRETILCQSFVWTK